MPKSAADQSQIIAKARRYSIRHDASLLEAIKTMDQVERKLLVVFKDDRYFGLLSIGDIQRKLLQNFDLVAAVHTAMRRKQRVAHEKDSPEIIREKILSYRAEMMPVIDDENNLVEIYFWEDFFPDITRVRQLEPLETPVVIMAGGQGTRLKPITNVIPKALVPIGDRPIIEEIIHRFQALGAKQFYVSLNYKGDLIQHYFKGLGPKNYEIDYFQEDQPLGTAGGLSLIRHKLKSTFFVSNCDILVEQDYGEVYKYHCKNRNQLTVVGVMKNLTIPYGTIEVDDGGILRSMQEKPQLNFLINSGVYLMEPGLLDLIPSGKIFHATDLIAQAQAAGLRVGVFPVNEGSWQDIGEWSGYVERVALANLRGGR